MPYERSFGPTNRTSAGVERRDLLGRLDRAGMLDLDDPQRSFVRRRRVEGQPVTVAAMAARHAPQAARRVAQRAGRLARVVDGRDARNITPSGAVVERATRPDALRRCDAYERVHAGGARPLELWEQRLVAGRAMLEIDKNPIEPGEPARLGGRRAAEG
jgi:hypothetical protein